MDNSMGHKGYHRKQQTKMLDNTGLEVLKEMKKALTNE